MYIIIYYPLLFNVLDPWYLKWDSQPFLGPSNFVGGFSKSQEEERNCRYFWGEKAANCGDDLF